MFKGYNNLFFHVLNIIGGKYNICKALRNLSNKTENQMAEHFDRSLSFVSDK